MKTWKQGIFGILAVIALAFAFTACDDGKNDPQEEPKNQTATIENLFAGNPQDRNCTATVKGYLTDTEWNGVAVKVETLLYNAYNNVPEGSLPILHKGMYTFVFQDGVTITVVKNPSYSKYQVVDGKFRELNLNYSALNTLTNKEIDDAREAMRTETPKTE